MSNLSPIKYRLKLFLKKINPLTPFTQEGLRCYRQKLPQKINVSWKRDKKDGYIVGKVQLDDGYSFMTQGKNAKDFIEMVNDSIYAIYEIPTQYIDSLGGLERFLPPNRELEKLQDESILRSKFNGHLFVEKPALIS